MRNNSCRTRHAVDRRLYRLSLSVGLAFILLVIPVTVIELARIPLPALSQPQLLAARPFQPDGLAGRTVNVQLPFGAKLVHATGGLTITKSAAATVDQGEILTYSLTIENDTGQPIVQGTVIDPIMPAEVSCFVPGNPIQSPPGWSFICSNNFVSWQFSPGAQPIANGSSVQLAYKVEVAEPIADQYNLLNSDYQITSTNTGASDIGAPVSTLVNAPSWEINKTPSSSTIGPNEYLTYTITVINVGHLPTSGDYTITEQLPTNTDPASVVAPDADINGSMLTWTFPESLAALGGSRTVTYSVRVNSPLPGGTTVVNDAYTVSGGNTFAPGTNGPVTVTVVSPVSLSVGKVASPDPVQVDDLLDYTITVSNTTPTGPAEGVVITDTLPTGLTFQSAGFLGGVQGTVDITGDPVIVWVLTDTIAPSDSIQVRVSATVDGGLLPDPPVITNNFRASANNAPLVTGQLPTNLAPGDPDSLSLVVVPTTIQLCAETVATTTIFDQYGNPVPGVTGVSAGEFPQSGRLSPPSASGSTNADGKFVATFQGVQIDSSVAILAAQPSLLPASENLSIVGPAVASDLNLTIMPNPLEAGSATAVLTATVTDCLGGTRSGEPVSLTLSDPSLATFTGLTSGSTDSNGNFVTTIESTSDDQLSGTVTITGTSNSLEDVIDLIVGAPVTPVFVPIIFKQQSP